MAAVTEIAEQLAGSDGKHPLTKPKGNMCY
jgi:hypothetical protein